MQTMSFNDHKFCEMTEHSLEENRHRAYWRKNERLLLICDEFDVKIVKLPFTALPSGRMQAAHSGH